MTLPTTAELRELLEKATPEPWYTDNEGESDFPDHQQIHAETWGALAQVVIQREGSPIDEGIANLALIALAPTLAQALIEARETEAGLRTIHASDMNDIVLLGLARDGEQCRAENAETALQKAREEIERLKTLLDQAETQVEELILERAKASARKAPYAI